MDGVCLKLRALCGEKVMQRLTIDIPAADAESGERFAVYGNVDAAGRAIAAIDYDHPLSGEDPQLLVPLGDPDADQVRQLVTPPLYFGWYELEVRGFDALGNATIDGRTFRQLVNSGPRPVNNLRHASTDKGRPVFAFGLPGQMLE
jgi:hypothetical protein